MIVGRPIVIIGSGGHSRVIIDSCARVGRKVAGVLAPTKPSNIEAPFLGDDSLIDNSEFVAVHEFMIGVGDMAIRRRIGELLTRRGGIGATVIDPSAIVGARVSWGEGLFVCAGVVIGSDVKIGRHVVVNTKAGIDHDCVLGDYAFVGPGVTLAGGVQCGEEVLFGVASCVIPNVRIGHRTIIGAGAAVISNIEDDNIAMGIPARGRGKA